MTHHCSQKFKTKVALLLNIKMIKKLQVTGLFLMLFNPEPNKQAVEILFSKHHEKDN